MAVKGKSHKKSVKKPRKSASEKSRPKSLAPKSARRKIDPATGIEISRRQFEKKYGRKTSRKNSHDINRKIKLYYGLRDDYIEKQKQLGKRVGKKEAMQSDELKNIVKDLHKAKRLRKQGKIAEANRLALKALKKTTRRDGIPDSIIVGESPKLGG